MHRRRLLLALAALAASPAPASASEEQLDPAANRAYDTYAQRVQRTFVERLRREAGAGYPAFATLRRQGPTARPAGEDGIIEVDQGLLHHWFGAMFFPNVSLARVLEVSKDYANYHAMYKPIIGSSLLSRQGDTYQILLRLKEGASGVSAVLDIRSTVQYVQAAPLHVYAVSNTDEIREVRNAGRSDERKLPAGNDSGYLWRASALSNFVERDGGVYVEMETLGLTRRFPPFLGPIIEPIARRLGRKSVEASLQELGAAVAQRD